MPTRIGYPVIVRPAYTLGGTGGGIAYDEASLREIADRGIYASAGWARCSSSGASPAGRRSSSRSCGTARATSSPICSMENIDPVGVHTGDSIVVAPTQTLANKEYPDAPLPPRWTSSPRWRSRAAATCQFALNPDSFEYAVIEVNPRVSRSSALASKATGYPIAKVAAKIALGYTLDEIPNAVTGKTTACFEPTLDYCVLKIPRLPFDKFTTASRTLGTQMKATGEVMAIANSFEGALMKAIRSLELNVQALRLPKLDELYLPMRSRRSSVNVDDERHLCGGRGSAPGYLHGGDQRHHQDGPLVPGPASGASSTWRNAQAQGAPDSDTAAAGPRRWALPTAISPSCAGMTAGKEIKALRESYGITPAFKMVDTCAAEFDAETPYYYSTYDQENEADGADNGQQEGAGAGLRPHPHRPGHRVRLLLGPLRLGLQAAGL